MVDLPALNTPQFGWVKSRLKNQPQPVPPIFQPEVAARAIYYAAHHPRRQFFVGTPTVLAPDWTPVECAKLLETCLHAKDVLPEADSFAARWKALGRTGADLVRLLRTLFNEVSLSPWTGRRASSPASKPGTPAR